MSVLKSIGKPFTALASLGDNLQSFYLLLIRLGWGILLFYSGSGKLADIDGTAKFFESVSVPFPVVSAYAAGLTEYIGGACLILGLATRLVCIPLLVTMIVALATAHIAAFSDPNPLTWLTQPPTTFVIVILTLFIFGPGRASLDYFFQRMVYKQG